MSTTRALRVAIAHNCQSLGMGNCIRYIANANHKVIDSSHLEDSIKTLEGRNKFQEKYDIYIVSKKNLKLLHESDVQIEAERIILLPSFEFEAYHPDICYLETITSKNVVKTAMDTYNSNLAFKGYKRGLNKDQILDLFRENVYQDLGYFDMWQSEKNYFVEKYKAAGININGFLEKWDRDSPFMFSWNHPRIECLFDIMTQIFERPNLKKYLLNNYPGFCPVIDNLKQAAIFPIYPEIAEYYGAKGSYTFKLPESYRTLTLEEFVTSSLNVYKIIEANEEIVIRRESQPGKQIDQYLNNTL